MTFKRTFHPVGQGAFFTEKFYAGTGETVFSVVYDCGMGIRQEYDDRLRKIINNAYKDDKDKPIDLIFISHFDCDHVNGLVCLSEKNLISEKTLVVVPFSDESKALFCFLYPYVITVFQMLERNKAKVIFLSDSNEDRRDNPISIEDLNKMNQISSGQAILFDEFWCYVPFNLGNNNKWHERIGSHFHKLINKLSFSSEDDFHELRELRNIMSQIRIEYRGLQKCFPTGSANSINMNSLQLFSSDYSCFKQTNQVGEYTQHFTEIVEYSCNMIYNKINSSCLYTGDTTLTETNKQLNILEHIFKRLDEIVTQNGISKFRKIGMIQIPHHGSYKCYSSKIASHERIASAFVNYSPNGKAKFDAKIITDFERMRKPLFRVTDNENSITTFTYPSCNE